MAAEGADGAVVAAGGGEGAGGHRWRREGRARAASGECSV